ncbi:hypothetical protein BZA05DRAFT_407346 [Tricharina praecox]|uniref:uncharacterized protein n=1 Tax=Tricharina praecox TaxID=43433 RepID=UPI00221FE686|nr:uncharacterized protein BZA05DRAFT_407346 [Tricharina praecox]KAI5845931.1 hypothetical protein BZA05DRAFT_407346 [Tricharina praecox]
MSSDQSPHSSCILFFAPVLTLSQSIAGSDDVWVRRRVEEGQARLFLRAFVSLLALASLFTSALAATTVLPPALSGPAVGHMGFTAAASRSKGWLGYSDVSSKPRWGVGRGLL